MKFTIDIESVRFIECPTNDTWARDHGGITVFRDGVPVIYDFKFNGWGLKFAANYDNLITSTLYNENVFNALYENKLNFVLEGGALESDGAGTLLTTSECLLSPNRIGALYVNDRIFVCKSGQCVDVAIGVVSGEIAVVEP